MGLLLPLQTSIPLLLPLSRSSAAAGVFTLLLPVRSAAAPWTLLLLEASLSCWKWISAAARFALLLQIGLESPLLLQIQISCCWIFILLLQNGVSCWILRLESRLRISDWRSSPRSRISLLVWDPRGGSSVLDPAGGSRRPPPRVLDWTPRPSRPRQFLDRDPGGRSG